MGSSLEDLVRRFVASGDSAAMEAVGRTRGRLLAVARRIGAPQDAEDSVQGAYHTLLRRAGHALDAPVLPWLLTTVVRIAYRRKALQKRENGIARRLSSPREEAGPAERATRREERTILRRQVARLPAKYRDPVVLYHLEDLSTAEAAGLLEIPLPTLKTRLQRARRLLRSQLSPQLLHGFVAIPWLLADVGREFKAHAALGIGGTMKAKTIVAVSVLTLAAGTVGVGIGTAVVGGKEESSAPARAVAAKHRRITELEAALLDAQVEKEELQRRVTELQAGRKARAAHVTGTEPQEKPQQREIPERVREAAKALGVSGEALRAAFDAYGISWNNAPERLTAPLKAHGEEGFRAVVALIWGGMRGLTFTTLFKSSWSPSMEGSEQLLIETVERTNLPVYCRSSALRGLAVAGTPAARDYLVELVHRNHDRSTEYRWLFYVAAQALGQLKEPRALDRLLEKARDKDWSSKIRQTILSSAIQMTGDDTEKILIDLIRDEKFDLLTTALFYLSRIDAEAAKREAEMILDGPRGKLLSGEVRDELKWRYAGRRGG
ncbi:MAG: sigma-70 family RNA polymerase sigma factor [Planctomycetota bacterium]|nr:sigma-70 family RNA polymerase sigma factor [Planctomycetota bacterium]